MARFRLFPRDRKPSLGELLGGSQAERQVSRKHKIRIVRDPLSPLTTAEPWAAHRAGYASEPRKLRLLATNRTYRQLASELLLSEETVRGHVEHILRKLAEPDRSRTVAPRCGRASCRADGSAWLVEFGPRVATVEVPRARAPVGLAPSPKRAPPRVVWSPLPGWAAWLP